MNIMIGQRIKDRRKELHITQAQIKEATGISTGNLSEIENGHILPSSAALMSLSTILECSVDYLLFGESRFSEKTSISNIEEKDIDMLVSFHGLSEEDQEEIKLLIEIKSQSKNDRLKRMKAYYDLLTNVTKKDE